jgi:hypothetical protein
VCGHEILIKNEYMPEELQQVLQRKELNGEDVVHFRRPDEIVRDCRKRKVRFTDGALMRGIFGDSAKLLASLQRWHFRACKQSAIHEMGAI